MDYRKYEPGGYRLQFGGFSFFPPVIKYLLIANGAAFVLQLVVENPTFTLNGASLGVLFQRLFYLNPIGDGFLPWQLFTYMFLHGSLPHILLNMFMVWMFGAEVENTMGSTKFLAFYFACGVFAGLANLFITPLLLEPGPTIGASGSVYGVLVAFAVLFPNRYVFAFFLLPIKSKYLISFFIILEVYNGVTGTSDGVAHFAHLGGAVLAGVWLLLDARGKLDPLFARLARRRAPSISSVSSRTARDADFYDISSTAPKPKQGAAPPDANQKIIDAILDKIGTAGYSALSEEEKRLLLDASRHIHPDKDARDA